MVADADETVGEVDVGPGEPEEFGEAHAARAAVIFRKLSLGSQSEHGERSVRSAVVSTSVALTRDPLANELPGGGQKGRLLAVSQGLGVRLGAVESCLEQFGEALCEGERE